MEERPRRSVDAGGWVLLRREEERSESPVTDEGDEPTIEALCCRGKC